MRSMKGSLVVAVVVLLFSFASEPAAAGFGISPPTVFAHDMLPGSENRGRISLVRCCPEEDEVGQTRFRLPADIRSWVSVNVGERFILPQGVQLFPVEVVVEVPEDATPGSYSGSIDFLKCPPPPPGGGIGICLGVRMTLDIRVVEDPVTSFRLRGVTYIGRGCNLTMRYRLENTGNQPGGPDTAVLDTYDRCCPLDGYRSSAELTDLPEAAPFSEINVDLDFPSEEELGGRWGQVRFFNQGVGFASSPRFVFEGRPPRDCPAELEAASFEHRGPFAAGPSPRALDRGDLDGDGLTDVAVANTLADTVTLLRGDGLGSLSYAGTIDVARLPRGIAVGDLDLDGALDLAVTSSGPYNAACGCYPDSVVGIFLNDGTGQFAPSATYDAGLDARDLEVADLDADGDLDLVLASQGSNAVAVLLGNGDGTFGPASFNPSGSWPTAIAIDDFDRDGHLDIVSANKASDDVSILLGKGDGSFESAVSYGAGKGPRSISTSDLDGDVVVDLVVANPISGQTTVFLGLGDGTFQSASNRLLNTTSSVVAAKFTGDDVPDIVVAGGGDRGAVTAATGDGAGAFGAQTQFSSGPFPSAVATGDFYRDEQIDLAVTNESTGEVTLLLNNFFPLNRPPTADAGSDRSVECASPAGTPVVLDGTASSDPDQDELSFTWTGPFGTASGPTPEVVLGLGEHVMTLTVDDGRGESDSDEVVIRLQDTTPPAIESVLVAPPVLGPPNHKMAPTAATPAVSDLCDIEPVCALSQVTSNEPVNGLGDGDSAPDWLITGPLTADLRKERSGTGSGRIYTLELECTDDSGNSSVGEGSVSVPVSQQ